jgi:hypothetical protein
LDFITKNTNEKYNICLKIGSPEAIHFKTAVLIVLFSFYRNSVLGLFGFRKLLPILELAASAKILVPAVNGTRSAGAEFEIVT